MMKKIIYMMIPLLLSAGLSQSLSAQVDRREVRKGNRDFRKENYKEADIEYRKALVKDSMSVAAGYNLGATLYRQGDFEQAAKVLDKLKEVAPATEHAADYYYNVGDVAIAAKNWQAAVDALKQSLLRNPDDLQAKENYIYAKKMLENQQNQQQNQQNDQNQNDQNDQNQDQQQDQQDQNKDQNKDQNNQNRNDQDQQQDRNEPQDGQQPKITPQAAQQMLQAIQAKEKETQEKVKKEKAKALNSRQKEKNW